MRRISAGQDARVPGIRRSPGDRSQRTWTRPVDCSKGDARARRRYPYSKPAGRGVRLYDRHASRSSHRLDAAARRRPPAGMTGINERSWFGQAWDVAQDLLIATALVWTLPLLLGIGTAIIRLILTAIRHDLP